MSARHDRLTELFTEAIDLDGEARAALVERVRASEPSLAGELATLLAADAEQGAVATGGLVGAIEKPRRLVEIAGYRILDVIGEGGMGTVYAAEQDEPRRRVAIKVLFARSASALVRFKAEAQIMARLDHPGIARVLEAGDADGQPYLVMEHVEGVTLDRFARGLSREERLRLVVAICDAVQHAHMKGVIHRDLKPSNVMVRADGRVVVLDFGVARLAGDDQSRPGETRAGELIGTPIYMSPEQADLRPDAVDARSDVYTLGVIVYELLCDALPYEVRELPLAAVARVICDASPVPLRTRDPALRKDLDAITGKALAKDPADRYQSVAALADDLRRFLGGRPVAARTPSTVERMWRFARRRPLAAAAMVATLLAATTFAVVVTTLWLDARAARTTAEHALGVAETARQSLESRTNQLVLKQARAVLERDPTEAVAWLATLTGRDVDAGAASVVLDEALARGVAADVLHGHTDEVHWVESITGGSAFVTAGYDGKVILWEPPRFEPRTVWTAAHGRAHAACPSPDGTVVAVGGDDGEAAVIDRAGRVVASIAGHAGDVQYLAWSSDGAVLATGDDRGHVRVWSRTESRELVGSTAGLGALAFSGDGRALIAGDRAGHVWLWDRDGWRSRSADGAGDVAGVWTDGARAIAVGSDGRVHRWGVDGDSLAGESVIATTPSIKRVAFGPGAAWLVLGGVGGEVSRIDATAVSRLGEHAAQIRSLAVSPDGRWVADGADDGTLVLRDLQLGREYALRGHNGRIRHLDLTATTLLSADSEGIVRRWDLGALGPRLLQADRAATRLATDGKTLAAVDAAGSVTAWTLADGARARLGHAKGHVTALALAGDTVVTGTAEGEVTWWSAAPVTVQVGGVVSAIVAQRDRVAVATRAGGIALFTAAGAPAGRLAGHDGGTEALAFDATGELLASGGQDRFVRVWRRTGDVFSPSATAPVRGDLHLVTFTPDGRRIVAAGSDGAVYAWDVRERALVDGRTIAQHTGAVLALAVTSRMVASAGRDERVVRTPLDGGVSSTTQLGAAAIALAIDARGIVHAQTRAMATERAEGPRGVVEIDHGVQAALSIDPERWVVAHDDGALVVAPLTSRPLEDLPAAVARATHYALIAE